MHKKRDNQSKKTIEKEDNYFNKKDSEKKDDFIIIGILSIFFGILISLKIETDQIIFADWFTLLNILLVFLIFTTVVLVEKMMANHLDLKIKLHFLESNRMSYQPDTILKDWKFPWWFILPFCLYFFSFGTIIWPGVINFSAESKPSRISKEDFYETEWHIAGIAFVGFLSALTLGLLFTYYNYEQFSLFCNFLALTLILPFGHGSKIFFGSLPLWIFGIVLTVLSLFFINLFSPIATLILSGIFAFLILIFFLWKTIKH
jgi:hypothetical protein